ncbi:MAG: adenine phosphoribosyltransferase [Candidatus Omnitrophota bacterium]|nr:MAG: adenine phosphoribosyltransferase [Candidatus Omnitrophota bacterium]
MDLKNLIRTIPDFPKKGILFRDITTLLNNRKAFKITVNRLATLFKDKKIDYIVCAEARGFILGGALAYKLGCGFVPVRKPGKLPYKSYKVSYGLEYGKDSFCIHRDAFPKGAKILIVDDLLATGGTAHAIVKLVRKLRGKIVGIVFLIELLSLRGRRKLKPYPVYSLIKF